MHALWGREAEADGRFSLVKFLDMSRRERDMVSKLTMTCRWTYEAECKVFTNGNTKVTNLVCNTYQLCRSELQAHQNKRRIQIK